MFLEGLKKIGSGILYGIGLCIVLYSMSFVIENQQKKQHKEYETIHNEGGYERTCGSYKQCEDTADLVATVTSERIGDGEFTLLGKLENKGDIRWTSASLKAELYDDQNNFIDECSEYVQEKIFPNETVNFKLSCKKCNSVHLKSYDSFKLKIIDANTY